MEKISSEEYGLGKKVGLLLGLFLFLLLLFVPPFGGISEPAKRMLGITLLMATWWITEAVPLAVTALLPLALYPILNIASAQEASANYADQNIFLFIGGFLIAFGLERSGLHKRFAYRILSLIGGNPSMILLSFLLVTWALSMWISNTATTLMMLPIGLAVLAHISDVGGDKQSHGHIKEALMLGIAYAASLGGVGTLIGTPPNIIFKGYLERTFPEFSISFAKWMLLMVPFSLVFLLVLWLLLMAVLPVGGRQAVDKSHIGAEARKLGRLSRGELMMLTVFILTALLWTFRADINLGSFTIPGWSNILPNPQLATDSTVAMAMALLCFILPVNHRRGEFLLSLDDVKRIPWHIILLFGGGFALAQGISTTGLDIFLGSKLIFLKAFPIFLVVAFIALLLTFLTEVTSNTATTSAMLPLIGPLAVPLGVNPILLLLPATLNASFAFMLPVATPPNAIVFGSGYVRMNTMVRVGLRLNFIGVILTTIFIMLASPIL